MAGLPTLNGRDPNASTPSNMWGQAPGSNNPFRVAQPGGMLNPFAQAAAGKGVQPMQGGSPFHQFPKTLPGPKPPTPPPGWQQGGGQPGSIQPPPRPGDWRGQGPGVGGSTFGGGVNNTPQTPAPYRDKNGFPAVKESGSGWLRYMDGSYADMNSLAVQKANAMNFGTMNGVNGQPVNLDQTWQNVPLSWRADMAQNWDPVAIKNWLEGVANPDAYWHMDGQKMTGSQMAAYIKQKMDSAVAQQKARQGQTQPATPDAGRVSPGIGG